ncbi:unnamed protein product [Prunus armeniaca]|uniref:Uncharacterized protein n=1 Tax=Prunus armeniaca TaxID=36596 RepID=A0A6J5XAI2_PRUAR|nr:unnamed protein product [Prunus armeniaca]CAB4309042.1 unnamed protein product [Prunus armeniaca]
MTLTSSNSEQPQFITSTRNRSFSNARLIENTHTDQIVVPDYIIIVYAIYCELWPQVQNGK